MAGRKRALTAAMRAMDLYSRYRQTGDLGSLNESIDVFSFALSAKHHDLALRAAILSNLGNALRARSEQTGSLSDVDAAIDACRSSVGVTPDDDPSYAGRLSNLGNALRTRFQITRNPADIDEAVTAERDALAVTPHARRDRAKTLANLASALTIRFLGSGDLADIADIDGAIDAARGAVAATSPDDHDRTGFLRALIDAVSARLKLTADLADRDLAIELHGEILQDPAFSMLPASLRVHVLRNAGANFLRRYRLTDHPADLQYAFDPLQEGIELAAPASEDLGSCLFNLAQAFYYQYEYSGERSRLEAAIAAYERIGREVPDEVVLDLPLVLMFQGHALHSKALSFDPDALDPAIGAYRRALDLTPEVSPEYPERLSGLGLALRERFHQTGRREDIDQGIELQGQAVASSADNLSTQYAARDNLGRALIDRYDSFGAESDLNQAIVEHRRAAEYGGGPASARANALASLGHVMYQRYQRTGDLSDLDEAIRSVESAIAVTNNAEPAYATRVNSLAMFKGARFERTNRRSELDEAVRLEEEALAVSPAGSTMYAGMLSNLGNLLFSRFLTGGGGDPADYTRGMAALMEAAEAVPPDSIAAARIGVNLSSRQWAEYVRTKDPSLLEDAIAGFERILARAPDTSSYGLSAASGLAHALRDRFRLQGKQEDRDRAVGLYRDGIRVARVTAPEDALRLTRAWGSWAGERQAWSEASDALASGIEVMHGLVSSQLLRSGKESWLREASGLPVRAAYARARAGDAGGAVADLESGRAVILSEALDLQRADLESLVSQRPDLFERYRAAADRWDQLGRRVQGDDLQITEESPFSGSRDLTEDLRRAKGDLDAAVADIRTVPGYERFLLPSTLPDVIADAGDHLLAYLGATELGGLALIVRPAGASVEAVWLPELTEEALAGQVRAYRDAYNAYQDGPRTGKDRARWESAIDAVTAWAWEMVMAPVLQALGEISQAILIPAGLLGVLPLHAAWTADPAALTGRRYALDRAVLIYAPSARALGAARLLLDEVRGEHLVAVDQPDLGTRDPRLRLLFSSMEAGAAMAVFGDHEVISGTDATAQNVLNALARAQVFHLSCHGRADPAHPLQAALAMAGGRPITLRDILGQRLRARVGVLSACETAIPGDVLPDEVVALPTGLIQAGAAAAVASLWAVPDVATAFLMFRFYERWRLGGAGPPQALRDAQRWLRDTTNDEKVAYFEEIAQDGDHPMAAAAQEPYELLYRTAADPARRDHESPYHWAAFTCTGA